MRSTNFIAVAVLLAACSSGRDDVEPSGSSGIGVGVGPTSSASGSGGDGGGSGGGSDQGGAGGDQATGSAQGGSTGEGGNPTATTSGQGGAGGVAIVSCLSEGPLGDVPVERVDADDCVAATAGTVVLGPDSFPDAFDQLVRVGDRRIAGGSSASNGPIGMDLDGSNADAETFLPGGGRLAAREDVVAITVDSPVAELHLFGPAESPIGEGAIADAIVARPAVASFGAGWVVAFPMEGSFVARSFGADATPGELAELVSSAVTSVPSIAAAGDDDGALVVYVGDLADGGFHAGSLRVAGGRAGMPQPLFCSRSLAFVVDLITTADGAVALLAIVDETFDRRFFVLRLDREGLAVPPAHELLGAADVWGIRSGASGLAVAYTTDDERPAVRFLDGNLAADGVPVCLTTEPVAGPVALDVDGDGFVALHPTPDGGLSLTSVD